MLRRRLAVVSALVALTLPALVHAAEGFQLVSADQVERMLGAPDVKVYDVNVDELWEKHHLPSAIHVGEHDLASILPPWKATRLVFYCSGPK